MARGDITLSEKHGVNPAIPKCFYCGDDKNEVILAGQLPNDMEAPRAAIWDIHPCDACLARMKVGIILISVKDGQHDKIEADANNYEHNHRSMRGFIPNPHRTGKFIVIKESALRRAFEPSTRLDAILTRRWTFMDEKAWERMGLDAASSTSYRRAEGAD